MDVPEPTVCSKARRCLETEDPYTALQVQAKHLIYGNSIWRSGSQRASCTADQVIACMLQSTAGAREHGMRLLGNQKFCTQRGLVPDGIELTSSCCGVQVWPGLAGPLDRNADRRRKHGVAADHVEDARVFLAAAADGLLARGDVVEHVLHEHRRARHSGAGLWARRIHDAVAACAIKCGVGSILWFAV